MKILVGLEPLEVIVLGLVKSKSITVMVEGVAGTVLAVAAALVDVRVAVAVQDGHGQVVLEASTRAGGQHVVIADSVETRHLQVPIQ
jgi:hypothetical protein